MQKKKRKKSEVYFVHTFKNVPCIFCNSIGGTGQIANGVLF